MSNQDILDWFSHFGITVSPFTKNSLIGSLFATCELYGRKVYAPVNQPVLRLCGYHIRIHKGEAKHAPRPLQQERDARDHVC